MKLMNWNKQPFWSSEDETGAGESNETTSLISGEENPIEQKSLISDDEGEEDSSEQKSDEPHAFDTLVEAEAFKASLPEGMEITDEEAFGNFLKVINESTSREALATSLLGMYSEALEAASRESAEVFQNTQKEWQAAVKSDPTYGGEKLTQSLATAKAVAKEYGGKEFLNLLSLTGAGNNVAMVAFLNKVAEVLPKEGRPIQGAPAAAGTLSLADRMFGKTAEGN